jgi:hypothetical protein
LHLSCRNYEEFKDSKQWQEVDKDMMLKIMFAIHSKPEKLNYENNLENYFDG